MFVTNWISTTKIQKISEITNFFRHYFLSRTEVIYGQKVKTSSIFLDDDMYILEKSKNFLIFFTIRFLLVFSLSYGHCMNEL